ncbi:RNA exonuclease 4 [Yarrowia sp. B02]|nr:RNA exonuclease 4 [Yarrowia sp. B02]
MSLSPNWKAAGAPTVAPGPKPPPGDAKRNRTKAWRAKKSEKKKALGPLEAPLGRPKNVAKSKVIKCQALQIPLRARVHKNDPSRPTLAAILQADDAGLDEVLRAPPQPVEPVLARWKCAPGKFIALDCEFVGMGPDGARSILARVSIVNYYGHMLMDEYVKPIERVTDWRTWVSGVTPAKVANGISFAEAQERVKRLLNGRVLIGHALINDLAVLGLDHPRGDIRDTQKPQYFKTVCGCKTPSLKHVMKECVDLNIQQGEHSSVIDAQAAMLLFRCYKREF